MENVTLTQIGSSVGLVIPKETLKDLNWEKGDKVTLSRTSKGLEITPRNAEFERQMEIAEKIMHRYRNALQKLAE